MFFKILLFKNLEKMTGVRGRVKFVFVLLSEVCLLSRNSPNEGSRVGRGEDPCSSEQPVFCRRAEEQPWSLTWPPSEMSNTGCTFFCFS